MGNFLTIEAIWLKGKSFMELALLGSMLQKQFCCD